MIFDEQGRVLLCHPRDNDVWNLPGGGVESGEMPTEAVFREVMEETGLEVEIERLVGVYGKIGKDEYVFSFICRVTGGSLYTSDDSIEYRYFEINHLPSNTAPKHAERILDTLDVQDQPVFRRQTAQSTQEMLKETRKRNNNYN
jgi:ADP-ribose pyrophosphatase YjhB (NUDIX family)